MDNNKNLNDFMIDSRPHTVETELFIPAKKSGEINPKSNTKKLLIDIDYWNVVFSVKGKVEQNILFKNLNEATDCFVDFIKEFSANPNEQLISYSIASKFFQEGNITVNLNKPIVK